MWALCSSPARLKRHLCQSRYRTAQRNIVRRKNLGQGSNADKVSDEPLCECCGPAAEDWMIYVEIQSRSVKRGVLQMPGYIPNAACGDTLPMFIPPNHHDVI